MNQRGGARVGGGCRGCQARARLRVLQCSMVQPNEQCAGAAQKPGQREAGCIAATLSAAPIKRHTAHDATRCDHDQQPPRAALWSGPLGPPLALARPAHDDALPKVQRPLIVLQGGEGAVGWGGR